MTARGQIGRDGEALAADYLRARGYRIVDANWKTRLGELDIVAAKNGQLVFVEVRSRSTVTGPTAMDSVGPDKQRRLLRMAEQYMQERAPDASARIDVVTVLFAVGREPEIQHVVGAVEA